jgi:hypothetical protein
MGIFPVGDGCGGVTQAARLLGRRRHDPICHTYTTVRDTSQVGDFEALRYPTLAQNVRPTLSFAFVESCAHLIVSLIFTFCVLSLQAFLKQIGGFGSNGTAKSVPDPQEVLFSGGRHVPACHAVR